MTPASKTRRPLVIGEPDLFWKIDNDFWRFHQNIRDEQKYFGNTSV